MSFQSFKEGFQRVFSLEVAHDESWKKHYRLIGLVFALFGLYINAGYQAQKQQRRIAQLEQKLEDAHFEYLTVSAQLVEQTRQSNVAEELEKQGSDLKISDRPAVLIK